MKIGKDNGFGWSAIVLGIVLMGLFLEYYEGNLNSMLFISLALMIGMIFWIRGNMVLRGQRRK